jgi:hypothetical protein
MFVSLMVVEVTVSVEWLTLLLRIREVPDSDLGPNTGYRERLNVIFLSPLGECRGRVSTGS